jgi:hypothetical protein
MLLLWKICKNIWKTEVYLRCFHYPIAVLLVVIVHISKLRMAEKIKKLVCMHFSISKIIRESCCASCLFSHWKNCSSTMLILLLLICCTFCNTQRLNRLFGLVYLVQRTIPEYLVWSLCSLQMTSTHCHMFGHEALYKDSQSGGRHFEIMQK